MNQNLSGYINLLKLKGATIVSVDINGKKQNCVMIPVAYNDIKLPADNQGIPIAANLSINEWSTNENFRIACASKNAEKENYTPPSHEIRIAYSKEFRELAETSAYNRILQQNKVKGITEDSEESKKNARYAVSNASRCGLLFPIKPKQQQFSDLAPAADIQEGYTPSEADYGDLPF